MHEAARAIDIDTDHCGDIGHKGVREILNKHNWCQVNQKGVPGFAAPLSGSESWHYEYRSPELQAVYVARGYTAMVKAALKEVSNVFIADYFPRVPKLAQLILKHIGLYSGAIDGIFGPKSKAALVKMQCAHKVYADGKFNEVTWSTLKVECLRIVNDPRRDAFLAEYFEDIIEYPCTSVAEGLIAIARMNSQGATVEAGVKTLIDKITADNK